MKFFDFGKYCPGAFDFILCPAHDVKPSSSYRAKKGLIMKNNTIVVNGYVNWNNVDEKKLNTFMRLVEKKMNWYDKKYAARLSIMIKNACVYNEYTLEEIQEIGSKWQHGYSMPSQNCLLFVDDFIIVKFNIEAAKNGYYNIHFENGCLR